MRIIQRVNEEGRATSLKIPQRLTTAVLILPICSAVALAQSNMPPRQQIIRSSHNIPKAPVGQRQPTEHDLSGAKRDDEGLLGEDADDKALDKKIKSICRGCSRLVDKSSSEAAIAPFCTI